MTLTETEWERAIGRALTGHWSGRIDRERVKRLDRERDKGARHGAGARAWPRGSGEGRERGHWMRQRAPR